MREFKAERGFGFIYILVITILFNLGLFILNVVVDTYVVYIFIRLIAIIFNLFQLYYIILAKTLKYYMNEENIQIKGIWGLKKVNIPIGGISEIQLKNGEIKGVKLTGYGKEGFAFGRFQINKVGLTRMFVTSNKNVLYLTTPEMIYAISPVDAKEFQSQLNNKIISNAQEKTYKIVKNKKLYKDLKFMIPFFLVTIIILTIILIPLGMYIKHKLPYKMPLLFNDVFQPIKWGTPMQFVFKQMAYGALNMAVLFCMYYAAYFYSKYDRKTSYALMYICIAIALLFLFMQIRIINNIDDYNNMKVTLNILLPYI